MSNTNIDFIMSIARLNAVLSKELDWKLWGIWFTDFVVLYYLNDAEWKKLRRIDLAEKVGLTPSWITRLLLPMEKIGLISKEINKDDARVSFVMLAPGWKRMYDEALERAEIFTESIFPEKKDDEIKDFIKLIWKIWWKIMWR